MSFPTSPITTLLTQRSLVAAALASYFIVAGAAVAAGQTPAEPNHMKVLFSENDALCVPLARLYDRLSQVHHYAEPEGMVRTEIGLSWEDEYAPQFQAIGLQQPQPLNDPAHPFRPALSAGNALVTEDGARVHFTASLSAYYRLDLANDRKDRIVYIEDLPIGGHGAFGTNVWIFKFGRDVKANSEDNPPPGIVDLRVFFSDAPRDVKHSRHVQIPYFFDKILSPSQRALPTIDRIRNGQPNIAPPTVIQRLFLFNNHYYIIARELSLANALVYRYQKKSRIDDVCYFSTSYRS